VNVTSAPQRATPPAGIDICAPALPGGPQILTPTALDFVAKLHRAFELRRQNLLTRRAARQEEFDAGQFQISFRNRTGSR